MMRIIKYWCKVVNTNNVILKYLNKSLLDDCQTGLNSWARNIKSLLDTCGFSYIWNTQIETNFKQINLHFNKKDVLMFSYSLGICTTVVLC